MLDAVNYRRSGEAPSPGDGIGIRTGLRSQVLWVRVPPRAPYSSTFLLD